MSFADLVPYLKALHIAGLVIWCAGLFALPTMLARHDPAIGPADYERIRRASHFAYTLAITPAAVIAVIAGTWLILVREVYEPWLYLKLLFVAFLVGMHGWIGHSTVAVAENAQGFRQAPPFIVLLALTLIILTILALVLGKPELGPLEGPVWLTEPLGRQLPFDVPRR